MLEAYIEDFKGLEGDCKELLVSAYINHISELTALPKLPEGAIVIGDNWSYSARTSLTKQDLNPANSITRELRERKIDSIQYVVHYQGEQGKWPHFESVVLNHFKIPPRVDDKEVVFDSLFEFRRFLALFLVGDNRLSEAEMYRREYASKRNIIGIGNLPMRILFLYDSHLHDKGVINLYQ